MKAETVSKRSPWPQPRWLTAVINSGRTGWRAMPAEAQLFRAQARPEPRTVFLAKLGEIIAAFAGTSLGAKRGAISCTEAQKQPTAHPSGPMQPPKPRRYHGNQSRDLRFTLDSLPGNRAKTRVNFMAMSKCPPHVS